MTEQLKIKDLENLINKLKEKYPDNYKDIPIYLGNDDELNGIHTGWYCEEINQNDVDALDLIEMINDDRCNVKFEDIAILIS